MNFPWLELLLAANVNALLDVAGLWLKEAPAPLGRPEVPESHLAGKAARRVIVIALVLVEPGFMNKLPRDAERLKFAVPAGCTASETLVECMVVRLVPGNR